VLVLVGCGSPGAASPSPSLASATPGGTPSATVSGSSTQEPAASATAAPSPAPDAMLLRTMAAGLRLRADAGVDADVIATLPAGATVSVLDGPTASDGMAWYHVRFGDEVGWIAAGEEGEWLTRVANGRIGFACPNCGDDAGPATMTAQPDGTDMTVLYPRLTRITWSPDGSRVALEEADANTGRSELLLMAADGSDVQSLGSGSGPAWSPDGERFAYVDQAAEALLLIDGDRDPLGLTVTDVGVPGSLAWSPDGSRLAFIAIDCPECPPGEPIVGEPPMSVFVFEPPGGAVLKVADGGWGGHLRWLPDGSGLTFVEYDFGSGALELRVVDLESGAVRILAEGDEIGYGHAFSPDAGRVVTGTANGIVVFNADGSDPRTVVPATAQANPMPQNPRWSPDGQWVLYDMVWVTGDAIETWVIRSDGTGATRVAELGNDASWQPVLEPLP